MNANDRYGSTLLKAADIGQETMRRRIHNVLDSERLGKLVLQFAGWDMELALNATNAKALIEAFGEETDYWEGEQVDLDCVPVQFKGEWVDSIRLTPIIREVGRYPEAPEPAPAPASARPAQPPARPAPAPARPAQPAGKGNYNGQPPQHRGKAPSTPKGRPKDIAAENAPPFIDGPAPGDEIPF